MTILWLQIECRLSLHSPCGLQRSYTVHTHAHTPHQTAGWPVLLTVTHTSKNSGEKHNLFHVPTSLLCCSSSCLLEGRRILCTVNSHFPPCESVCMSPPLIKFSSFQLDTEFWVAVGSAFKKYCPTSFRPPWRICSHLNDFPYKYPVVNFGLLPAVSWGGARSPFPRAFWSKVCWASCICNGG